MKTELDSATDPLPSERIRRALQAMMDGGPLADWDFSIEDVAGLLQERDTAVGQLVNAVAPVMEGARQAQLTLERNAIDAAATWAREGGYSRTEVSGLVGAIHRALHPKERP